ncbi:hypothetical protein SUGI_0478210 [Cryptomeria japonica]|nr:hypothetical protein SUGI_0478210 [Cryptomeria japonica]
MPLGIRSTITAAQPANDGTRNLASRQPQGNEVSNPAVMVDRISTLAGGATQKLNQDHGNGRIKNQLIPPQRKRWGADNNSITHPNNGGKLALTSPSLML